MHGSCLATIGEVGNAEHELHVVGQGGQERWMGKRPKVRGEVMNPVDHPHGGRTRGGRNVVSPWGKKEGVKTRNKKKPSQRLIVRGRKRGKAHAVDQRRSMTNGDEAVKKGPFVQEALVKKVERDERAQREEGR